jgi:methylthioribose-1-phosphate isomerase
MKLKTIEWHKNRIKLVDQTRLPLRLHYLYISQLKPLWQAIKELKVRGAPALGAAAGLGVYLGIKNSRAKDFLKFNKHLTSVVRYLASSRPTARNLFWALERMQRVAVGNRNKSVSSIKGLLFKEAKKIVEEDQLICRRMANFGAKLIKNNDRILTVCNTGILATVDYGTALGAIYRAKGQGKRIKVYACETRPLLQGARLTAWELKQAKIDSTLICDNMAADLMRNGLVDKVFVGADRIAANGDTANKIGTYSLAVLARFHALPFYVVAPSSTFDLRLASGKKIVIENRPSSEVTSIRGVAIAPKGIKVYNPAFDVTSNKLVSAIITEKGIIRPPFTKNIKKILIG